MSTETSNTNLLNNVNKYLLEHRDIQSKKLQMRLNVFTKVAKDQYGAIENIKDISGPIESARDIDLINTLIRLKTFATIPVFNTNKELTHIYTIGLWYYWGLPEIVLKFDESIKEKSEYHNMVLNIVLNIIHDKLFAMYHDKILGLNKNINQINFDSEPSDLNINLDNFDIEFNLKRVESDQYMDIKALYMLWFYTYYMEARMNDNSEPLLYPVYQLTINNAEYSKIFTHIIDKLITHAITNKSKDLESDSDSDTESDSGSDSDSESNSELPTIHEQDAENSETENLD
jgi:hypothetical protein